MSNKIHLLAALASAAVVAGLGAIELSDASMASAAPPGGCSLYRINTHSGEAICPPNKTYRVLLTCTKSSTGGFYYLYGPWTTGGDPSVASCNPGDLLQNPSGVGVSLD